MMRGRGMMVNNPEYGERMRDEGKEIFKDILRAGESLICEVKYINTEGDGCK